MVVEIKKNLLLFRLALAILCNIILLIHFQMLYIPTTSNFHNPTDTNLNWNFGFLLTLDVRNASNKCSAEKPCEVNAGDCTSDNECRGNLICTQNNCEGSALSFSVKCCQEPGDDIFYISIWSRNHYVHIKWWMYIYFFILITFPKNLLKCPGSCLQKPTESRRFSLF